MDFATITAGVTAAKGGFDVLRTAIGLVKDVQSVLPDGEKKEVVGRTLDEAEKQLRLAEAQIADALGYTLCRCAFPPTPMLLVGYRLPAGGMERALAMQMQKAKGTAAVAFDVHECPRCGRNDAADNAFARTVPDSSK